MRVLDAALPLMGLLDLAVGQRVTTPVFVVRTLGPSMTPQIAPGTGQAIMGVDEPPPPPEVAAMQSSALSWISEQRTSRLSEIALRPTTAPWPVATTAPRSTTTRAPVNLPPVQVTSRRPNVSTGPVKTMSRPVIATTTRAQPTPVKTMSRLTTTSSAGTTRRPVATMSRFSLPQKRDSEQAVARAAGQIRKRNNLSKLERRQTTSDRGCTQPELNLLNYIPRDSSPSGFIVDSWMLSTAASNYIPPAGYYTLFQGQIGGLFTETRYMGYHQLAAYNTTACAVLCNREEACGGFNMYFERNPLYTPNNVTCLNPSARGAVTCALYGRTPRLFRADEATNFGQWRNDFMLTITGSNGYIKSPLPAQVTNFRAPQPLYGAVNPYSSAGSASYLTAMVLDTQDGIQEKCAKFCRDTTAANRAKAVNGIYKPCNYFNTFNLVEDGWNYKWSYCVLYSSPTALDGGYVNAFLYNNAPLNVTYSHGVALFPPDSGKVDLPWEPAPEGSGASCAGMAGKYGTTYRSYNDRSYTFSCGYDVQYASDVGNETSSDFFSCFDKCDKFQDQNCDGFAYAFGTCWFKKLTGQSRTPQLNSVVDMAWLTSGYLGFEASKLATTVTYPSTTTMTVPGTAGTVTATSFINGVTGVIVVSTPVVARNTVQYVTITTEVAMATTVPVTATGATDFRRVATVTVSYPVPPSCTANGSPRYYYYTNVHRDFTVTGYPQFSPEYYKSQRPVNTAGDWATYLGVWDTTGSRAITQYATRNFLTPYKVISHQFYVYANRGTGFYHFNIPYSDDITLVWFWDDALSGWTRRNAQMTQTYTQTRPARPLTYSFYLNAGTYVPIRIVYANGGEAANFGFNILGPDGSILAATTNSANSGFLSEAIVFRPCDASLGAPFPTWDKES